MILCKYSHEERATTKPIPMPERGIHPWCSRVVGAKNHGSMRFALSMQEGAEAQGAVEEATLVGNQSSRKNSNSHIDASHSRQPLVKGERLVRYEVNAVMTLGDVATQSWSHLRQQGLCVGLWMGFARRGLFPTEATIAGSSARGLLSFRLTW